MSESVNAFMYLLSGSDMRQYGSFHAFKIRDVFSPSFTSAFDEVCPVKEEDIVCVATAFNADVEEQVASNLISSLRASAKFQKSRILLNDVMHTVEKCPAIFRVIQQPVIPSPVSNFTSEDLIHWLRLQIQMKDYRDSNQCDKIPKSFFDDLGKNDRWKYPELLHLAFKLQSSAVCWHLSKYFVSGQFLSSTNRQVSDFFDVLLHGHDCLSTFQIISMELDTFLQSATDSASELGTVGRKSIKKVFDPYFHHFQYLKLVIGDDSYVLKQDRCKFSWYSFRRNLSIVWLNNWSVSLNGKAVATKVVTKSLCIPGLSCLQAGGEWSRHESIKQKEFCVELATELMYADTCVSSSNTQEPLTLANVYVPNTPKLVVPHVDNMMIEVCFRSRLTGSNDNVSFAAFETSEFQDFILKCLNQGMKAIAPGVPVVFEQLDRVVVKDGENCNIFAYDAPAPDPAPVPNASPFKLIATTNDQSITEDFSFQSEGFLELQTFMPSVTKNSSNASGNVHAEGFPVDSQMISAVVLDSSTVMRPPSAASHVSIDDDARHIPSDVVASSDRDDADADIVHISSDICGSARSPQSNGAQSDGEYCSVPVGIQNTGALCCYICLLQAWFHIKSFRKSVFDASLKSNSLPFTVYLSSIFHCLQTGNVVDLKPLVYFFGIGMMQKQQDVHEIYVKFFELLGEPARKLFGFKLASQCMCIHYKDDVSEVSLFDYDHFNLEISSGSISECLSSHNNSIIQGDNGWNSLHHGKQDAQLIKRVLKAPAVLHLSLNRFMFSKSGSKNLRRVTFGNELEMDTTEGLAKYVLASVLVHSGYLNHGHYISFVKKQNRWFRCDDCNVTEVSEHQAIDGNFGGQMNQKGLKPAQPTAYMLIYVLASAEETAAEPVISESAKYQHEMCVNYYEQQYAKHSKYAERLVKDQCDYSWHVLETLLEQSSLSFRRLFYDDRIRFSSNSRRQVDIITVVLKGEGNVASFLSDRQLSNLNEESEMLHLHLLREVPSESGGANRRSSKNLQECTFSDTLVLASGTKYLLHSVVAHAEGKGWRVFTRPNCWRPNSCAFWYRCDSATTAVGSNEALEDNFGGKEASIGSKRKKSQTVTLDLHQSTAHILIYVKEPANASASGFCYFEGFRGGLHVSSTNEDASLKVVQSFRSAQNNSYLPALPPLHATASSCFTFTGLINLSSSHADHLIARRSAAGDFSHPVRFPCPESFPKPWSNVALCRTPYVADSSIFINDSCIDWFFMALTVLFPAYMYLPCTLCGFKQVLSTGQSVHFQCWISNFRSRRPIAVLLPVNLPKNTNDCLSLENPGFHWVLIAMACFWDKKGTLSKVTVTCLDSCTNKIYIDPALGWFTDTILPHFFNGAITHGNGISFKLQTGSHNNHCGAYCMAFGLNFVMDQVDAMHEVLLPSGHKKDSSAIGLELRKMAAWDSVQDPPLLDACLYMCRCFHSRTTLPSHHQFWSVSHHHDLRKSLSILLESQADFVMSGYSHANKKSKHFHQEFVDPDNPFSNSGFRFGVSSVCVANNVSTDGPFFFSNDTYFVKVHCIGLLSHFHNDRASVSRARRAFHDASATSSFCKKMGWSYKSFGLICVGLATPCCFVCIARPILEPATKAEEKPSIGSFCVQVTRKTSAMHGDVHLANFLWNRALSRFEFVDCERAFRVSGEGPSAWFYSWYANSVASHKTLEIDIMMDTLARSGLDATSCFFTEIYKSGSFLDEAFDAELFERCPALPWSYDTFLHLMELLSDHNPVISGTISKVHVTFTIASVEINIHLSRPLNGQTEIQSVTFSPQQDSICIENRTLTHAVETQCFYSSLVQASQPNQKFSIEVDAQVYNGYDSCEGEVSQKDKYTSCSQDTDSNDDHKTRQVSRRNNRNSRKRPSSHHVSLNEEIFSSCKPLPNYFYLIAKMRKVGNPHVLESIKESMMRRFNSCGSLESVVLTETKPEPRNALRREHFGCETVLVCDQQSFSRCITFISSQEYLSLDTESTTPRYDDDGISLLQIGSTTNVFIFRVDHSFPEYSKILGEILNGKQLLCWGADETTIKQLVFFRLKCPATFINVQKMYSPTRGSLKALADGVSDLFSATHVLSKSWTFSGWDNETLTREQLTYATLDVVACHALYVAKKFGPAAVYQREDDHITFFNFNISSQTKLKHGFSFTPDFLGHFNNGSISRGFRLSSPSVLVPTCFLDLKNSSHSADKVDVTAFVDLLNSKKFCCYLCTPFIVSMRKNWLFFVNSPHKFSLWKHSQQAALFNTVDHVSDDEQEQAAFLCFRMLAVFFHMPTVSPANYQSLKTSVCSDIYYGYIRETLAHFVC